jgi:glycosyltransferase involved in cell wall biosynthesis
MTAAQRHTASAPANRVLLSVSGMIPADAATSVEAGRRPRIDYLELASALGADLVDHASIDAHGGRLVRVVRRLLGRDVALAWCCWRRRGHYDVILTDGEQVGLPYAALTSVSSRLSARHVMIVHILSVPKKSLLFRAARLGRRIDEMVVYSSAQRRYIVDELGYPAAAITSSPFMVDTRFFSADGVEPSDAAPHGSATICAAGLEFRDYPTLIEAVRGLGVRVVLAAASPWSKRPTRLDGVDVPGNVEIVRLDLHELRQLYADSTIVVMPLRETDFQAGVTTLLEAMAMAKPIICSKTTGQTDVITDDVTGVYVPVGDSTALRSAIEELLDDSRRAARLGRAARAWVTQAADIDVYVASIAHVVDRHRP